MVSPSRIFQIAIMLLPGFIVLAPGPAPRAGELAPPSATPSTVIRVQQTAPCTCRAFGRDYGMGESVCLRIDGRPAMAECGMFLNNTSWRSTGKPCPEG
jgi:hypothetical protein